MEIYCKPTYFLVISQTIQKNFPYNGPGKDS